jgi:branched-chain amino acid transport system substrate-binding protein
MSGDALVDQQYWQITGPTGEGTLMTFAPDPRNSPAAKDVVAKFKAQGYDPEGYTLYTYAAFQVFAEAAERAKSLELDKLIKVLREGTYNTVIGPLAFDEKGDIKNPEYVMYRWSNGQYTEIKG